MTNLAIHQSFMRNTLILFFLYLPFFINAQIELNNDEFSDPSTLLNWININESEGWNITQLENYNIGDTVAGNLFMLPLTESWFGGYRGAYLYKEIAGDFVLTTRVAMSARDGVSLPSTIFSLAGIMIRSPQVNPLQDPQNYIFMSVGRANQNRLSFEIKNTCDGRSCLSVVDASDNEVTMRLVRRGDEIIVLSKFDSDLNWTIQNRYDRNDIQLGDLGNCGQLCDAPFPDTIQVGFVSYTDWPKVSSYTTLFHNTNTLHPDSLASDPTSGVPFNPDIRTAYDYIRFDTLNIPSAWDNLNISDATQIPDSAILNNFSFDSNMYCPDDIHVLALPVSDQLILVSAKDSIKSNVSFSENRMLQFSSGQGTTLEEGFGLISGAVLEVILQACVD